MCCFFISSNIETSSAATLGSQAKRLTGCSTLPRCRSRSVSAPKGLQGEPWSVRALGLLVSALTLNASHLPACYLVYFKMVSQLHQRDARTSKRFILAASNVPSELGDVSEAQQHSFQTCWQQNQPWQLKMAPLCSLDSFLLPSSLSSSFESSVSSVSSQAGFVCDLAAHSKGFVD